MAEPVDESREDEVTVDDESVAELEAGEAPRRGRRALVVSGVLAVLLVGFVAVLATREPAKNRRADSPILGEPVPALAGETLDGGSFDVDDQQGRWVIVNFFATWCVPCREEHPELVSFDRVHSDVGDAVLVSVLFDDRPDVARDYFENNGGEWPVVIDGRGQIALDFAVSGVPETYLVSPDGRVFAKLIGGVTQQGIEAVMAEYEELRSR